MSPVEGNQLPEDQQGRPLIEIVPEGHYRFSGTYTAAHDAASHGASRGSSHGTPHGASNITLNAPDVMAGAQSGADNTERSHYRSAAQSGQAHVGQWQGPQGTPTGQGNVANIQHFDLPPITKETTLEVPRPEIVENVVEVPHVQYIERILEVPHVRKVPKRIQVPKMEVTERVIEIPKHVKEQSIVEVPQLQIVDHVVEVPQYITQPKIIEVPQTTLQERIIPILKRTIEEKIVEVPEDQYDRILQERVEYVTPAYGPALPQRIPQVDDGALLGEKGVGQPIFGPDGKPLLDATGRPLIRQPREQKLPAPLGGDYPPGQRPGGQYTSQRPVDVVVEVPHVQHVYRNVMQPVYRHIPKPVEVPLTHYRPVPVERIIDRNVPIPVELEVVQEFLCPRIEAKYVEVPVPIPVTRVIEKPVPADAMFNSAIMEAYMKGKPPVVSACVQNCGAAGGPVIPKAKMSPSELQAAGIQTHPSFAQVKSFKSRGASFGGFNVEHSRDFLTQQRTLQREGTRRS